MTELDIIALIITAMIIMVIMGIIAHEMRPSKKFPEYKKRPVPPRPERMTEILTNKDGSFLKQDDGSYTEIDTPCKKIIDLKEAAMFGQDPPEVIDVDELANCQRWLWMIATVNACDYEYQKWARMATNGVKCEHNFRGE